MTILVIGDVVGNPGQAFTGPEEAALQVAKLPDLHRDAFGGPVI